MQVIGLLFAATLLFMLWFLLEKRRVLRDRTKLEHVIHVNGTRGKSTVCRLIDAGLRAGGFRVYCKTTGTLPMTIDVSGQETQIKRISPSNIREQLRTLHRASQQDAQILVVECMAISPPLQSVSQCEMLCGDIGVITNVRLDHLDVMGTSLEEICDSLCSTIPNGGVLFTAESILRNRMSENAAARNCQFFGTSPVGDEPDFDFPENIALALTVCEYLGVSQETALVGMANYHPDPYALSLYRLAQGVFVNALSANDAQSTELIYQKVLSSLPQHPKHIILLFNNRFDRGSRTQGMLEFACSILPDEVWLLGSGQEYFSRGLISHGYTGPIRKAARAELLDFQSVPKNSLIFAAGNIAGEGKYLFALVEKEGERIV